MSDTETTDGDVSTNNYDTAVEAVTDYLDEHVDELDYVRSSHLTDDLDFSSKQIGHALGHLADGDPRWEVTKWSGDGSSPITWRVERRVVADGGPGARSSPGGTGHDLSQEEVEHRIRNGKHQFDILEEKAEEAGLDGYADRVAGIIAEIDDLPRNPAADGGEQA